MTIFFGFIWINFRKVLEKVKTIWIQCSVINTFNIYFFISHWQYCYQYKLFQWNFLRDFVLCTTYETKDNFWKSSKELFVPSIQKPPIPLNASGLRGSWSKYIGYFLYIKLWHSVQKITYFFLIHVPPLQITLKITVAYSRHLLTPFSPRVSRQAWEQHDLHIC